MPVEPPTVSPWSPNSPKALMSEGGDWYAFPKAMTKREVVSEMIHNYADWWLDEYISHGDDDKPHGWVTAIRAMFNAVEPSHLRPADPDEYGYSENWWYETDTGSVEAWVVRL